MTAEVAALETAAAAAGPACAVVVTLGARGAAAPALLNEAIGTALPTASNLPLVHAAVDGRLVLAVGELDSRTKQAAAAAQVALVAALHVAGVVVLSIRLCDVGRPAASGVNSLFEALASVPEERPRLLVLVVKDFDSVECTEAELDEVLRSQAESAFAMAMKGTGSSMEEMYEIAVVCVPHDKENLHRYNARVAELRGLLEHSQLRPYIDSTLTAPLLAAKLAAAQSTAAAETSNVPASERELDASYRCDARLATVMDKWRASTSTWKATIDNGRIVASFGKEVSTAISKTLTVYETDCAPYSDTRAMARKRTQLKARLLDEAYVLYARQIGKCRELAYQLFRAKLGRVRINDKVERAVHGVVRDAEMYFVGKAESLVVPGAGWRFDSTRADLVKTFRDDATERLQLARLQGNYVKPIRTPLLFAFHTLLAAPFGKDSRVGGHPQAEEMQTKFDPDKVKKAALLRNRPFPTKHIINVRGMEMKPGALDIFDELFDSGNEK